ncbi:hypothetical protein ACLB2K_037660 [Fragaria x ananassa]
MRTEFILSGMNCAKGMAGRYRASQLASRYQAKFRWFDKPQIGEHPTSPSIEWARALSCLQPASLPLRGSTVSRYELVAFLVFGFVCGEWDGSYVCDVGRKLRGKGFTVGLDRNKGSSCLVPRSRAGKGWRDRSR